MNEDIRYEVLVMEWEGKRASTKVRMYNRTIAEARKIAVNFGWRERKWYSFGADPKLHFIVGSTLPTD